MLLQDQHLAFKLRALERRRGYNIVRRIKITWIIACETFKPALHYWCKDCKDKLAHQQFELVPHCVCESGKTVKSLPTWSRVHSPQSERNFVLLCWYADSFLDNSKSLELWLNCDDLILSKQKHGRWLETFDPTCTSSCTPHLIRRAHWVPPLFNPWVCCFAVPYFQRHLILVGRCNIVQKCKVCLMWDWFYRDFRILINPFTWLTQQSATHQPMPAYNIMFSSWLPMTDKECAYITQ
jgi:hypothetical protein